MTTRRKRRGDRDTKLDADAVREALGRAFAPEAIERFIEKASYVVDVYPRHAAEEDFIRQRRSLKRILTVQGHARDLAAALEDLYGLERDALGFWAMDGALRSGADARQAKDEALRTLARIATDAKSIAAIARPPARLTSSARDWLVECLVLDYIRFFGVQPSPANGGLFAQLLRATGVVPLPRENALRPLIARTVQYFHKQAPAPRRGRKRLPE